MNIHPLWSICLVSRLSLLLLIGYLSKKNSTIFSSLILLIIGLGFFYKYLTGSNNEIQITKVFWHETRLVHGILFMLASYYLYIKNSKICMLVLGLDIIFSILYRIFTNNV